MVWREFEFKRTILEYHLVKLEVWAGWDWECLPMYSYIKEIHNVLSEVNQPENIDITEKYSFGMATQFFEKMLWSSARKCSRFYILKRQPTEANIFQTSLYDR